MAKAPSKKAAPADAAAPGTPPAIPPVVIFHGSERFVALDFTEKLRKKLIKLHGEVQVALFDGAAASPADILDELRSTGLMASQKLVIVDDADLLLKAADDDAPAAPAFGRRPASKSARELFEAYARAPEATAVLVLRANTWKPGKLDKAVIETGGQIVDCEPLSDGKAAQWVAARARTIHTVPMDDDAAQLLVDNIGTDLARLDSEAAKLAIAALAKEKPSISADVVREMTGMAREEDLFTMQSVLLQPDPEVSLRYLRDMLEVSRHNPVAIGLACLSLARQLDTLCRGLSAGENLNVLANRAKLWGSSTERLSAVARTLKPARTADLLEHCVETDARNKSGRGDPTHNIEALVLRFNALMMR